MGCLEIPSQFFLFAQQPLQIKHTGFTQTAVKTYLSVHFLFSVSTFYCFKVETFCLISQTTCLACKNRGERGAQKARGGGFDWPIMVPKNIGLKETGTSSSLSFDLKGG